MVIGIWLKLIKAAIISINFEKKGSKFTQMEQVMRTLLSLQSELMKSDDNTGHFTEKHDNSCSVIIFTMNMKSRLPKDA